ncbi:MAG: fluoride efflux transporter CrcB [Solirubrobacterales bacterium]|nr:fluoride efflux transporter CrcB [Solirubrobacterales bacterium]
MSGLVWLAVPALGALGALLRFFVDSWVGRRAGTAFPLGTLIVNTSGALVFGLLVGLGVGGDRLLLAGTATIGSYTTFSTWMLETLRLAEEGRFAPAAANLAISVAVGLGAAALGRVIGAHL